MKYISEITGKTYDSAEDCEKAEKLFLAEKEEESNSKKALCDEIEKAQSEIDDAYNNYEQKHKEATEILEKAYSEAYALIKDAKLRLVSAEAKKRDAVAEFNRRYGRPYTKKCTGEDAAKEFKRQTRLFETIFDRFFDELS